MAYTLQEKLLSVFGAGCHQLWAAQAIANIHINITSPS
jgi:hypothetical protein